MSTLERSARILAADFVMVVMPWAMTNQPSLQAGLLCSILSQAGISAKTFYANLAFASAMNWNQYEEFCGFHNHAADWLFSETVFGVFKPNVPESEPADFFDFARLHGNDDSGLQKLQMLKAVVEACLQECLSSVAWENVRIVGFTTTMLQPLPALAFARLLKGKHPHLKILMGGAGCQEVMGRAMHRNFAFIDGVVDGEADRTIAPLVRSLLDGDEVITLPGVHWRSQSGRVEFVPPNPPADLNSYPVPQFDDFFEQSAIVENPGLNNVRLPFEASRGCWWGERNHCAFCGLNGMTMKQRDRPTQAVAEEIKVQVRRYNPTLFICTDNIISQRHLRELPPALSDIGTPVFFEVGAAMSRRRLQALADAGTKQIQVGIESLSTEALKLMNKGTSTVLNVCFLRRAREFDIDAYWNFIYGLPGEDPRWYQKMVEWLPAIHHLTPPEPTRFSLQRFSPYFDQPDRYGIAVSGPLSAARYVWNLPDAELVDIGYELAFAFPGQEHVDETGRSLDECVSRWRTSKAELRILRDPDGTANVYDTRGGIEEIHRLSPEQAAILACTEKPTTLNDIERRLLSHQSALYRRGPASQSLEAILQSLKAMMVVLCADDRYLGLPVPIGSFWTEE